MIISLKEQLIINQYFKKFVTKHRIFSNRRNNDNRILKEIEKQKIPEFHNNWNYLMFLVSTIEKHFKISRIVSHKNYVGFEFDDVIIQDKGSTKQDAYFLVCFKTLKELWKEGEISLNYQNTEPFDKEDIQ
jgi:hypothetical protein